MSEDRMFRGVAGAVVQLLLSARTNGILVNRTKLAKLLYLSDLRAVDVGWQPPSKVEWRWRHYGPYSDTLREIEEDLVEAGVIECVTRLTDYGTSERRMKLLDAPATDIDEAFARIIEQVVFEYGDYSAGQLRDLTYDTPPMREAVKLGRREVRLDVTGGTPLPDLDPALSRLRMLAHGHPLDFSEGISAGTDDLAQEIDEFAEPRNEATRNLMGD